MISMTNDDLIAGARSWANIYNAALSLYSRAMDSDCPSSYLATCDTICREASAMMHDRLVKLRLAGLGPVADNIRDTRHSLNPELWDVVPLSLRLAEAPVESQEVQRAG